MRTLKEYEANHIQGSMHIPLNDLKDNVEALKALNKPFVVCCESGVRSSKAAKFLNLNNMQATNGDGWLGLKKHL